MRFRRRIRDRIADYQGRNDAWQEVLPSSHRGGGHQAPAPGEDNFVTPTWETPDYTPAGHSMGNGRDTFSPLPGGNPQYSAPDSHDFVTPTWPSPDYVPPNQDNTSRGQNAHQQPFQTPQQPPQTYSQPTQAYSPSRYDNPYSPPGFLDSQPNGQALNQPWCSQGSQYQSHMQEGSGAPPHPPQPAHRASNQWLPPANDELHSYYSSMNQPNESMPNSYPLYSANSQDPYRGDHTTNGYIEADTFYPPNPSIARANTVPWNFHGQHGHCDKCGGPLTA